jgi:hypothetical protein
MIRGRTLGPTSTFTPCSRGGSGAANTRRGPSCLRRQNWRTNSAAGLTPPRGHSGHSNATGWPGGFPEKGTYRPDPMFVKASHDAPSRLLRPPPFVISGLPPYSRVDRNHQQDVGSRTSASAAGRFSIWNAVASAARSTAFSQARLQAVAAGPSGTASRVLGLRRVVHGQQPLFEPCPRPAPFCERGQDLLQHRELLIE